MKEKPQIKRVIFTSAEYLYAISILKDSYAGREILSRPDIKELDPEPQMPHLKFVLLPTGAHAKINKKHPMEVGQKWQRF